MPGLRHTRASSARKSSQLFALHFSISVARPVSHTFGSALREFEYLITFSGANRKCALSIIRHARRMSIYIAMRCY
ncbi:hypothetical protein HYPGJ_20175 [Hyphomicrobium sp. GJ21]|nr:hypothetical protein HYPGJ_20175 [Hyphomicrobium sp. GJ21]